MNVQAEPKRIYIVSKSGTFQASETVTGGTSGATATLASSSFETNQSGRILVTQFATYQTLVTLYNLIQLMVMHFKYNQ